ncbi:MAG: hypothetical protein K2L87_02340 [Clostridiales bacterium]|nr:hypothetical protein [Clostridiales bacterium]
MKLRTKSSAVLWMAAMLVLSLFAGLFAALFGRTSAVSAANDTAKYYYGQLSNDQLAKNFYDAFEKLESDGAFKKGTIEYDLVENGVATEEQVKAYVSGLDNNRLARSYGAGRDAYYMDHPDLFYADVFATSISAGLKEEKYVAYLDSSRVLTTYRGNLNSETAVNAAIQEYESQLKTIVDEAKKLSSVTAQIAYVNGYIASHTNYGYGTEVQGDKNVDTPKAAFVYTSYGALVNRESVCEGYAKSFKAVMDRLGIPCACIAGAVDGKGDGNYQPHMWNAVEVEGMWYGVDVTYNATGINREEWLLVGAQSMFNTHVEDRVVSTSGYELRYPALKPYDYGTDTDDNGMVIEGEYTETEDQGIDLKLTISCENKGALKLEEEGKYLAYRMGLPGEGAQIEWMPWTNFVAINEAMKMHIEGDYYPITDTETIIEVVSPQAAYMQFALFNRAPDAVGDMFTGDALISYDPANLKDSDFIGEISAPYRNNGYESFISGTGGVSTSTFGGAGVGGGEPLV